MKTFLNLVLLVVMMLIGFVLGIALVGAAVSLTIAEAIDKTVVFSLEKKQDPEIQLELDVRNIFVKHLDKVTRFMKKVES